MTKTRKPKSDEAEKAARYFFDAMNNALAEVQKTFTKALSEPDTVGWMKLLELLEEAAKDEKIMASPQATAFVKLSLELIRNSSIGSTADDVIQPLGDKFISKNFSEQSKKRFEKLREIERWVAAEWIKDKGGCNSKAEFARLYVKRVFNEYGIHIKERNVIERWLKGL